MRPATDMELRVAKAIADSIGGAPEVWLVSARAAIKAMREPTAEMSELRLGTSDSDINPIWLRNQQASMYRDMINAASPDEAS